MKIYKTYLLILIITFSSNIFAQKTVKMKCEFGTKNRELLDILYFEDIDIETLTFESEEIKNKYFEINLNEYYKGKLVNSKQLFEGSESEYFKIDSSFTSFKFFAKMENLDLKTYIQGKGFGSRKETFKLKKGHGEYVLKDFQGSKKQLNVPLNEEFPILAIITATIHEDGSGSYCEVAQSDVPPEEYGEKFKIPHYFIITMKFK